MSDTVMFLVARDHWERLLKRLEIQESALKAIWQDGATHDEHANALRAIAGRALAEAAQLKAQDAPPAGVPGGKN